MAPQSDTELLDALIALRTECVIVLDPTGSVRVNVGRSGPILAPDLRAGLAKAIREHATPYPGSSG